MKKSMILVLIAFLAMNLNTTCLNAQSAPATTTLKKENKEVKKNTSNGEKKEHKESIPNLTDEQKQKIKDIRVKEKKDTELMKNQLQEKKAHLNTLSNVDKPDMAAINKTIDEMMVLKGSIMKTQMAARQEIRALLNDEQRVAFDHKKEQHSGGKKGKANESKK